MFQTNRGSGSILSHRKHRNALLLTGQPKVMLPLLAAVMGVAAACCCGEESTVTGQITPSSASRSDSRNSTATINTNDDSGATSATSVSAEIQQLLWRLKSAEEYLRGTKRYAATFTQQVYKDGRLLDPERMQLKVQHEPFAVFMQWERDGQQALYVQGQHDNKLLVHPTRGFGRLRRVWILEPDSGLSLRGTRRPVTEIGMLNMVNLLLGFHHEHILQSHCIAEASPDKDQNLTRYVLTFDGPRQNPYFARTNLWLCNKRHIPVRIENYSWTEDHQVGPLLERYDYADIHLDEGVTEADFDRDNEAYSF